MHLRHRYSDSIAHYRHKAKLADGISVKFFSVFASCDYRNRQASTTLDDGGRRAVDADDRAGIQRQ
jgi:hypothetical protein